MKKIIGLFWCLCLCSLVVNAQKSNLPPPFVITADMAVNIDLPGSSFQYFVAGDKQLSINDMAAYDKYFISAAKPTTTSGLHTLWIRYQIQNGLNYPLAITIPAALDSAEIYVSEAGGKWHRYQSGTKIPWSKKPGLKRLNSITYKIQPKGIVTVYKKVFAQWTAGINLKTDIGIRANVIEKEYINNDNYQYDLVMSSVLFGFIIFASLFNFFFYYTVREKVYLIYAITLFLAALSNIISALSDLAFREYPLARDNASSISISLLVYLAFILVPMFLLTAKNHPRWNKTVLIFSNIFLLARTVSFFAGNYSAANFYLRYIYIIVVAVIAVGLIVNIIADLVRKRFEARLFLLAICPFIIVFVLYLTSVLVLQRSLPWLEGVLNFSLIWMVIVLSWSLFDRYKLIMQQNTLQVLETERVAREAEQERSKLIAQQNEMLELQVAERTAELNQSLLNLKQTQTQLIQSEKMASLGELTAGIAHEIQNPLNFVNNFSEVSVELLNELLEEAEAGHMDDVKAIAGDLTQNLQKINHHGKRADGIVKGMLQHSRAGGSAKEPTDINKLADEYLRLAYHGLRSKDKNFNAELITDFAEGLPMVPVVSQDIGRVLLNLFNNAFYAVQQKQKIAGASYKPTIQIKTLAPPSGGRGAVLVVRDNGTGIPENIKDKILQPFFTTKPTGEGTGLGLSLSYDIIVKAHGGKIEIDSIEGDYTEFTISIPATT